MPRRVLLATLSFATLASFALSASAAGPTVSRKTGHVSALQHIPGNPQFDGHSNRAATNNVPFNCHAGNRSSHHRDPSSTHGYGYYPSYGNSYNYPSYGHSYSYPSYGSNYGYPSYGYSGYSSSYPSYSMPVSPFVSARAFGFGP